jgi:hypothetical protein
MLCCNTLSVIILNVIMVIVTALCIYSPRNLQFNDFKGAFTRPTKKPDFAGKCDFELEEQKPHRIVVYLCLRECKLCLKNFYRNGSRTQAFHSQHFTFFITQEWAQLSRVFHYTKLERLASDKHASLLGPFISYKEKKVL